MFAGRDEVEHDVEWRGVTAEQARLERVVDDGGAERGDAGAALVRDRRDVAARVALEREAVAVRAPHLRRFVLSK